MSMEFLKTLKAPSFELTETQLKVFSILALDRDSRRKNCPLIVLPGLLIPVGEGKRLVEVFRGRFARILSRVLDAEATGTLEKQGSLCCSFQLLR